MRAVCVIDGVQNTQTRPYAMLRPGDICFSFLGYEIAFCQRRTYDPQESVVHTMPIINLYPPKIYMSPNDIIVWLDPDPAVKNSQTRAPGLSGVMGYLQ